MRERERERVRERERERKKKIILKSSFFKLSLFKNDVFSFERTKSL